VTDTTRSTADLYAELRPRLFGIAYRMLGSVAEAEDVVQEAFLRLHRAQEERTAVDNPAAFLTTVTTRLAIDQLRSARARREQYVGPWLPEPLLADERDVGEHAELAESLSMAFLVVLERLSPVERAVFLLHDVFCYGYDEVAGIVGTSEANCRQLAARARRHVADGRPRFDAPAARRDELAARFLAACEKGDLDGLLAILAKDAAAYFDAGGRAPAPPRPIFGRERVARVVLGIAAKVASLGHRAVAARVNGQPGAVFLDQTGAVVGVVEVDVADGAVRAIRSVTNPDKLAHVRLT
jgi:RNA polymerase sigma-70 factor (ECF subfamily)